MSAGLGERSSEADSDPSRMTRTDGLLEEHQQWSPMLLPSFLSIRSNWVRLMFWLRRHSDI